VMRFNKNSVGGGKKKEEKRRGCSVRVFCEKGWGFRTRRSIAGKKKK